MKQALVFLVISIMLHACSVDRYPHEIEVFTVPENAFKCMVIGDWGRKGNTHLKANAYVMNELACRMPIDAVLTTGDNFYNDGVGATTDAHWNVSFENVFNGTCILPTPWYPSLGNHDVRGNTEAQIAYSQQSSRWNMPAAYYHWWAQGQDSLSIHFVAVDTSPFVDKYYSNSQSQTGQHVSSTDTAQALAWLDSVLGIGNPDWLVVYGHHPVYAGAARHGSTQELIDKFVPLFDKHGVDVYFCGHNHSLELIKTETPTLYVTSGGGSDPQSRVENLPYNLFGVAQSGFVLSSFTKDSLQLDFINKKGQRIYSYVNPRDL